MPIDPDGTPDAAYWATPKQALSYPRRTLVTDLRPDDEFEYERYSKYTNPQRQMVKDRVSSIRGTSGSPDTWRADVVTHYADGSSRITSVTLYTEIGQTNHGYVRLAPDVVVLLLDPTERTACVACGAKYTHLWHCPEDNPKRTIDLPRQQWAVDKYPDYYNPDGSRR